MLKIIIVPAKKCTGCREIKPLTLAYFSRCKRFGFKHRCRKCVSIKDANYKAGKRIRTPKPAVPKGYKWCSTCELPVPLEQFGNCKTSSDGKRRYCKPCNNEKANAYFRQNREAVLKSQRGYNLKNRAAKAAKNRLYRLANPEKDAAWSKKWRDKNPEKQRAARHRRRAREAGATGAFTAEEFAAKLAAYKGTCHWCFKQIAGTVHRDHLIPLSKGGSNDISNIVPSCAGCNFSKNARMPWEFIEGRLF